MLNKYRRAVLKISGEALAGTTSLGHDWDVFEYVAKEGSLVEICFTYRIFPDSNGEVTHRFG